MKPKTLPIWPGGAAFFTITSRGVREAPSAVPAASATTGSSASGNGTSPIARKRMMDTAVSAVMKVKCRL